MLQSDYAYDINGNMKRIQVTELATIYAEPASIGY
jgi:hypothetical protein